MKKIFITTLFLINLLYAEDIYATFDVVSEKSSELGLSVSGIVGNIYVNVGDKLKKGDLILALNNNQEKNEYETAKKELNTQIELMIDTQKSLMLSIKKKWIVIFMIKKLTI